MLRKLLRLHMLQTFPRRSTGRSAAVKARCCQRPCWLVACKAEACVPFNMHASRSFKPSTAPDEVWNAAAAG